MDWALGIDIGGTNLVVGAVAVDGRIVGQHSHPTEPGRGAEAILQDIAAMAEQTRAVLKAESPRDALVGVGVGAPGPLDTDRGVILLTPNLGWVDMPIRDMISGVTHLPTVLDNDANCAVLGEAWVGAAVGRRFVLGVTIGTGIGGGIIIDGKVYHGAADCAGEIGHMTIDMDGRRCGCGNYGCLEAYASGPAIAMRAIEQLRSGGTSNLPGLVDGNLDRVTAQTVYQAATLGDALAGDVVRATAQYLGAGIANLLNILSPDMVVIAGGVTQAGDLLFDPLRRVVAGRAFKPAVDACQIVPGTLDGLAGVLGAAKVFFNRQGIAH